MPSSTVSTFTDPQDYAASFRGAQAEVSVTERGSFYAKIVRVDLDRLRMHRFCESLPRVGYWANFAARAVVTFRTQPGPKLLFSGANLQSTNITRHSELENGFLLSAGPASFASMSLPVEEMVALGATVAGSDLTPPKDAIGSTPKPGVMAKLQRLHASVAQLAEEAPETIANPNVARGLEQSLIEALLDCLRPGGDQFEDTAAQRRHATIMRRFRRLIEETPDQSIYIPELCEKLGISDRTLRAVCQTHLGISPARYLVLRRMNLARRALLDAAPGTATVTEIATQFGFWELGRFSVDYRALFSEPPSITLARAR